MDWYPPHRIHRIHTTQEVTIMPYLELTTEYLPEDRYEWIPLELSDNREEVLQDFKSTAAEQEGWKKYQQDTDEYARAMSPTPDTPQNRAAVDHLKRLMGRG
jgi:hypothetical protein